MGINTHLQSIGIARLYLKQSLTKADAKACGE
jgi:hypothetical protein